MEVALCTPLSGGFAEVYLSFPQPVSLPAR